MSFWSGLKKATTTVVSAAVPVAVAVVQPEALINNAIGFGVKHKTKINNQSIPALNAVASIGIKLVQKKMETGSWSAGAPEAIAEGLSLFGLSTATHQAIKIPVRAATGKSI